MQCPRDTFAGKHENTKYLHLLKKLENGDFFYIYNFIYFRWRWFFVGLLFLAVHGLLTAVASLCGARALGTRASVVVACGLSSCGSWALERRLSTCGTRA